MAGVKHICEAVLVLFLLAAFPATAQIDQSDAWIFERTDGFDVAHAYSYALYDFCDLPEVGVAWRKAVRDQVEACPFPASVKERFVERAQHVDAEMQSFLYQYFVVQGGNPPMREDARRRCEAQRRGGAPQEQSLADLRRRLTMFESGVIDADQVTGSCASGGAFANPAAVLK